MNENIVPATAEPRNLNDINSLVESHVDNFLFGEGLLTPGNAAAGLIVLDDGRYLCQLRSQIPGIYYPDHWGLFGGAVDLGERPEAALKRELQEELMLEVDNAEYFTEFTFDFSFCGMGQVWRRYYLVQYNSEKLNLLRLGEGREFRAFTTCEILRQSRLVPYDAFAIWLHATQQRSNKNKE
jgi:8-oxo-dGTP pyrophosphatase MutT (NUDIX family)